MRQTLVAIALILIATSVLAKWDKVAEFKNGGTLYIDRSTVEVRGNAIRIWMLKDLNVPQEVAGKRSLSQRALMERGCETKILRLLAIELFPGQMGRGNALNVRGDALEWIHNPADSIVAQTLDQLCVQAAGQSAPRAEERPLKNEEAQDAFSNYEKRKKGVSMVCVGRKGPIHLRYTGGDSYVQEGVTYTADGQNIIKKKGRALFKNAALAPMAVAYIDFEEKTVLVQSFGQEEQLRCR